MVMWNLPKEICRLAAAIERLADSVNNNKQVAILERLAQVEKNIMATVAEWAGKVGPKLDRVQKGIDALQEVIEKWKASPGQLTPEDEAFLADVDAKVDALGADADSVPATPPTA